MQKELTKNELESQIHRRREAIDRRMDALQDEVSTAPSSIMQSVRENPLVGVGGALAGGLLVGLLVGGSKRSKPEPGVFSSRDIEALKDGLGEGNPVVFYQPGTEAASGSVLRNMLDLFMRMGLGMLIQTGMDYAAVRFGANMGTQMRRPGAPPPPTPGSETSADTANPPGAM